VRKDEAECRAADRETRAPFRGALVHFATPFHARDEHSKEQEKREKSLLRGGSDEKATLAPEIVPKIIM